MQAKYAKEVYKTHELRSQPLSSTWTLCLTWSWKVLVRWPQAGPSEFELVHTGACPWPLLQVQKGPKELQDRAQVARAVGREWLSPGNTESEPLGHVCLHVCLCNM